MIREERLLKVILAPHISEKSTIAAEENNTIVFKVANDATKAEVKAAVEKLFEVEVTGVRTLNVKGKTKRTGMRFGRRSDWKKAYVTLKEGSELDFVGGAELGQLGVDAEDPRIAAAWLVGEVVGLVDGEVAVARAAAGHGGHDGECEEQGRGADRLARKLWAGRKREGALTR